MKLSTKKTVNTALLYLLFAVISIVRAFATYSFIVPNAFAPGGIGGIASILFNVVNISNPRLASTVFNPAITIFVLNIPLLIVAFFLLNREFVVRTVFCVAVYAGFMGVLSAINFPVFKGTGIESGVVILASLAGGVLSGISLGVNLITNSSSGGTDIIARLTSLRSSRLNVNWLIFAFDCIVVVFSGLIGLLQSKPDHTSDEIFLNVMTPILYSFVTLFLTSQVADILTNGLHSSLVFNIITEKAEELGKTIIAELKRGATILKGQGVFTSGERKVLICVVRKRQSADLKRLVKKIDPSAFMYINKASEVNGFGFDVATDIPVRRRNKKINEEE